MAIQAQLPDGTTLQFPDGTPPAVVDGAVKQHISSLPGGTVETRESKLGFTPAPPELPKVAPTQDEYSGAPVSSDVAEVDPNASTVGRIGQAIVQGASAPPFLTPEAKAQAERENQSTWVGRNIVSPVVAASELPFRGLNALSGGLGQLAYETGNVIGGPSLGRDFFMGNQLAPFLAGPPGAMRGPFATETPRPGPPALSVPSFVSERTTPLREPGMSNADRIQQLVEHSVNEEQPEIGPPMARGPLTEEATPPQPTAGETAPPGTAGASAPPQPQPAGAQITPATELGLTPREEIAYRATAEGNKLLEPQEPGVRDDKQYLEGTTANEAEKSQDVQTARELKSLRQQTPELDAKMTADENNNNNIVTNSIHNALPGRRQIQVAEDARTEAMKTNEPKVFANATDADVQPIVQSIQDTLNEPKNRQNTQLGQYVRPLIDRLQNEDGTPRITDPKELWGFRQDVQHLTSKAAQVGDPNLSRVSGLLGGVLEVIDNQIEAAAPGYKAQLRDEYRTRSQEIDAMRALDDQRFKLFDSQNKPNYNAVQSLMRRIADGRKDGDPYDPYANVSAATLDKLWNIRDFMRRQVAADRLAAPKGAATSQNLGDALRAAGRMAVQNAGPVVGGTLGAMLPIPGVGPALGIVAGSAVNHLLSERAMRQRFARGLELTNPNQLMQPPSP